MKSSGLLLRKMLTFLNNEIRILIFFIMAMNFHVQQVEAKSDTSQYFLIVIAHPNPESFNHAILKTVRERLEKKGHEVRVRDLYLLDFQPLLSLSELKDYDTQQESPSADVEEEQQHILWANQIIFIYPTWWWAPPAILKGYFDRIFTPSFAFDVDEDGIRGRLIDKKVMVIQSTGAEDTYIQSHGMDDAVKKLMSLGIFEFCGLEVICHEFVTGINGKSPSQIEAVLTQLDSLVEKVY
jgi:NAD(P)H dehydrogenase (quinone)